MPTPSASAPGSRAAATRRAHRTTGYGGAALPPLRQSGPGFLKGLLGILGAGVLVVSGLGYTTAERVSNSAGDLQLGSKETRFTPAADGAQDIVLVGIDSRTDAQGNPLTPEEIALLRAGDEENENTDTIMLIRIPNNGSAATAISIPRDTYIHDATFGNMKINGVYQAYKAAKKAELFEAGLTDEKKLEERSKEAGRKALLHAISELSGTTIDHYAEVGLLGFVLLTDAVGGVEVCLNEAVDEPLSGAHFPAGVQRLSGADALSFVRQRHDLPRGDLDRIVRQQAYMASLVRTVLSSNTLTDPGALSDLTSAASRSLTIDDGWDIVQLAGQMQNLTGGRVTFSTIPVVSPDGVGDYGESVVTIDTAEVQAYFQQLLQQTTASATTSAAPPSTTSTSVPQRSQVPIHVLNASAIEGLAGRAATGLQADGFVIGEVGNAPSGLYSRTQVMALDPHDPAAIALSRYLGNVPIAATGSLEPGELVLVVAENYSGPLAEEAAAELAAAPEPTIVGQPGDPLPEQSPVITAGGNGPRCVN